MTDLFDRLGEDPTREDADEKLRGLLEQQHLILEMQATPGWEIWTDFLAAIAQRYQNRLLLARHKDILDVKFDAGLIEGIRTARGASGTLAKMIAAQREQLTLANQEDNDEREALASD